MTGRADYLALGDWNAVCYECGRKRKASQLRKHWQGYYVCPEHWEPRQTQDFVRNVPDGMTAPWAQPVPTDVFLPTDYDKAATDFIDFTETQARAYSIVLLNRLATGPSPYPDESLGALALGVGALAGSGASLGYENTITLSETVTASLAVVATAADTVTLGESVSLNLIINNALGEKTLGTSVLG